MTMRLVASCLALVFTYSQAFAKEMPTDFQAVVDRAHAQFKDVNDGANADYIPILATVPSEMFGVVIVTREGEIFSAGEIDYELSLIHI